MAQYNLKYRSTSKTGYKRRNLLEMTYPFRKLFNIPVGVGRIANCDESMNYKYERTSKHWTV